MSLHPRVTRRDALRAAGCGFGSIALAGLLHSQVRAEEAAAAPAQNPHAPHPLAPKQPHFPARAQRVVFLFMQGGPSHVDTFDYKPAMVEHDGTMREFDDARTLAKTRKVIPHRVMKSPWDFQQHGESGLWVSSLFPHIASCADDL